MSKKLQVGPPGEPRRGRPPRFGRPERLAAVTLPHDVVDWLAAIDPDLGRAIVRLHDHTTRCDPRTPKLEQPNAEMVDVGDAGALIVAGRRPKG